MTSRNATEVMGRGEEVRKPASQRRGDFRSKGIPVVVAARIVFLSLFPPIGPRYGAVIRPIEQNGQL